MNLPRFKTHKLVLLVHLAGSLFAPLAHDHSHSGDSLHTHGASCSIAHVHHHHGSGHEGTCPSQDQQPKPTPHPDDDCLACQYLAKAATQPTSTPDLVAEIYVEATPALPASRPISIVSRAHPLRGPPELF